MSRFKFRVFSNTNKKYTDIGLDTALTTNSICNGQFVIQQCLGVQDKNNRWIYEGDVVKYSECYEEVLEDSISEVIYSNACFLTKTIRVGKCKRYSEDEARYLLNNHNTDVTKEIDHFSPTDEYGTDWTKVEVVGSIADEYFIALDNTISKLTTPEDLVKLIEDKTV